MPKSILTMGQAGVLDEDGEPLDFPLGKPFGILVYLALTPGPVSRDQLADLFWNDSERARARHSVRQALSFIRKRLGEAVFAADDPVELDAGELTSDVAGLEAALEDGDEEAVRARYGGAFLATAHLASSPEWDHWVELRRRVLAERVAALFHRLSGETADPERGVALLKRAVEVEPHRASHRGALIERLLEAGHLEEATAALAEARQAELDDPARLEQAAARVEAVLAKRERGPDREALTPEFVGRSAELSALAGAWKRARAGRREIAIVSGPTGIGKTRLTEELAALVAADGARVVRVKSSSSERALEWGLTAELIRELHALPGAAGISGATEGVLRSLVPSLGSPTGAHTPMVARPVAISEALADLIGAVAYEAPLLVVLDDTQWVDRSSVALLQRTARQIRGEPILVVFTYRTEEVSRLDFESSEALIRDEGAISVRLGPLAEAEVEELLTLSGLEEPAARMQRLAERLFRVSRGHPLFLVELLRSLQDDGVLVRDGERWRLEGPTPDQLELPASVRGVIQRRLDQLGDDARRIARELASVPPGTRIGRIRVRSGLPDDRFSLGLHELLARDVVRWDPAGRLVFSHDQLRAVMEPDRRHGLRSWAAAVLVLLLVGAAGMLVASGSDELAYGGGTILVWSTPDSVTAIRPTGTDPREWTVLSALPFWTPEVGHTPYGITRPHRLTDGSVVWTGRIQDARAAPDAVLYRQGRPPAVVLDRPGDDAILGLSPDGRRMLTLTENLNTPQYDREYRLGPADSTLGRVVGSTYGGSAIWSPDGRRLALQSTDRRDTLVILDPAGAPVARFSAFSLGPESWCAGSREILALVRDSATAPTRRILLDVETGDRTLVDAAPVQGAACSPDGRALISGRYEEGRLTWTLHDRETGAVYTLPPDLIPQGLAFLTWLPDTVDPTPVRLRIPPDTFHIAHGNRARIPVELGLSDGTRRAPETVEWTSEAPGIASVLSDGQLSANRIGTTRVVARYDGWLADTVVVHVRGGSQAALALADDFVELDSTRWLELGHPTVRPTRVDGRPALELLGDGRYTDGIVSREPFTLPRGATLEVDLRMPANRPELQGVTICLATMSPPTRRDRWNTASLWSIQQRACFGYPAYELRKWSPDLFVLTLGAWQGMVARFPEEVDPADWVRVGIQILPNGHVSLWLDGRQVAEEMARADFLSQPVRIYVDAGTVGTRGFIRGLRLWAEPRYR